MKKSVRIIFHFGFWLFFPISKLISQWSGEFGIFGHMFGESPKSFWSVFLESFQFLIDPPDKGADFYTGSNLFGIFFNIYLYIILPVAIFYACYFVIKPKYLSNGHLKLKFEKILFILLVPLVITTVFKFFTIRVAFEYPYFLTLTYVYAIPFAFFGVIFRMAENWISNEKKVKQNLQSELALLKNQINPHFLFNTLNNIDSLIKNNTEKASETLVKLSEILRYMIYDTNIAQIQLSDEISHIESYIELQKLQFANRELVSLSVQGNPGNTPIAPMLFIPFVENAFKHCTDKSITNAIRIKFTIYDGHVLFESINVSDRTQRINKDEASGVGLNIVRRRLEIIYPGRHTLNIKEENNTFIVTLSVNTHEH
jgi:two-component system, LytTR family, sensor kinase